MALIAFGRKFTRDLETHGALAFYAPLEGGYEGRYRRRLRASGYTTLALSSKGLGDLSSYLMDVHGVRPPHLGKKDIRTYFIPPVAGYQLEQLPAKSKGLVLWLSEGYCLDQQELEYLIALPRVETRIKVLLEIGGARTFQWKPLVEALSAA